MTEGTPGRSVAAMASVTRLLAAAGAASAEEVEESLLEEARRFFGVPVARIVRLEGGGAEPPPEDRAPARSLLALPLRGADGLDEVLVLADAGERDFSAADAEAGAAFAAIVASSLAQRRLAESLGAQVARHEALARSAHALNESLDLPRLLGTIVREAAQILAADVAAVWRGSAREGVVVEAVHGFPPEVVGYRLGPGEGLAGRVAEDGRPLLLNDYARVVPPDSPFVGVECVLGVPMRWEGELHGVLAVGYTQPHAAEEPQLALLETFAELASVACRNASVHAGVAHAARTDGLTGCLNHAALHETMAQEIARCRRTGQELSLVLMDLDGFKQVNEHHGHLVGDEVLRRVGHALQATLRPYDHVARYGGDEFALVAIDAGESEAGEIAERATGRIAAALDDFAADWPAGAGGRRATAGVAGWHEGLSATDLVAEADRALLYGKQHEPGATVCASTLPPVFRPGRFRRTTEVAASTASGPDPWPAAAGDQLDRLRRRTRGLAVANALGARLAGASGVAEVVESAAAELQRSFGWPLVGIVRLREDHWVELCAAAGPLAPQGAPPAHAQPGESGLIGRCLRERRPILAPDVGAEPDYVARPETRDVRSELVVPILVKGQLWGAINAESTEPSGFDEDDARLLQAVADHVGAALGTAQRIARLEGEADRPPAGG
ncbi:MAG TPA: GAF domain-containing protein [Thermoleophilaceae bacterium]|nr:GAF domain-containing protein [Thermoleophilaceae bacterium]